MFSDAYKLLQEYCESNVKIFFSIKQKYIFSMCKHEYRFSSVLSFTMNSTLDGTIYCFSLFHLFSFFLRKTYSVTPNKDLNLSFVPNKIELKTNKKVHRSNEIQKLEDQFIFVCFIKVQSEENVENADFIFQRM